MEHKTFPAFLKEVDEAQGIVEHIFAVFGNVDEGLDVLHPGSFKKTLDERGDQVRVLDAHNTDSISRILGKPLEIREMDGKELPTEIKTQYPEATGGVWARTQFFLDTPEGKGAFIRLKENGLNEWSFGYDAVDSDYAKQEIDGKKVTVRNIRQLKLYEYSPVLWGMNPATATLDAKAADTEDDEEEPAEDKTVLTFQDLPLAARDLAWDADAAEARVREWAGGEDDLDWDKYAKAFMWRDKENPETFGAFKLIYATVEDDKLTAVPSGIFAVAAALGGARGGVDIPDADADKVREHVAKYYAKMREEFDDDSIIPPWDKAADTEAEPDKAEEDEEETGGNTVTLRLTIPDEFDVELFQQALIDALAAAAGGKAEEDEEDEEMTPAEKAGRVFSARNLARIRKALAELHAALAEAGLSAEDEQEAEEEGKQQPKNEAGLLFEEPGRAELLQILEVERHQLDAIRMT
jgi:HK97 family phage prohead protease